MMLALGTMCALASLPGTAQRWQEAAPRRAEEGQGPFRRLTLDGVMLIDGTGAPAFGPVSIVVEGNRIARIDSPRGPDAAAPAADEKVLDLRGSYVLPGFIDTHMRLLEGDRDMSPDYAMRLLLAHGVTTVASIQDLEHLQWATRLQRQSERNEVVAPRIQVWIDFDAGTPEEARARVRQAHAGGAAGLGEGSIDGAPEVAKALFAEANKLGMRVSWHMNPMQANRMNALDAARAGMHGLAHWYGLPETLFADRALQHFPAGYNFSDVRSRFRQSGRLWKQTAPPGSERWSQVLDEFLKLDFTFEPTFSVYEAKRGDRGGSNADWHRDYLHPVLEREFTPSTEGRFAQFYDWSNTDEVAWRENFRLWMAFVNEYKNRGGRVVAGSDSGYMWMNFGFGYVRNLEMLEEAGFTTLEVVSAATRNGAEHLRLAGQIGTVEPGKLADLVVVGHDPLENLKVLYGTGFLSLGADGTVRTTGGVTHTIKDGIVYDPKALLGDVRRIVQQARGDRAALAH